ncbi:MAG: HepT-like ribonuclease domain-containing protein, partial [Bacteroidota bacterium]
IQHYLHEVGGWEELEENFEKVDALQRRFSIIGETAYRLQKIGIKLVHSDWVINLRNTLVHQYDEVGVDTLWFRAQEDLPPLLNEVKKILKA